MNESPAELHHKMCKKVAQLTKVIFYLNTKNDEYESNLKSVVNAYESELDSTIRDVFTSISRPTPLSASTKKPQKKPTRMTNWKNK